MKIIPYRKTEKKQLTSAMFNQKHIPLFIFYFFLNVTTKKFLISNSVFGFMNR